MFKQIWKSLKEKYRIIKMRAMLLKNAREIAKTVTDDIVYGEEDKDDNKTERRSKDNGKER